MIDLLKHYDEMWQNGHKEIVAGHVYCDEQIDSLFDERFGITLLARPEKKVIEEIQGFYAGIQEIEADQYFYPPSDLHMTVLSIISCYAGFKLEQIVPEQYMEIIASVLNQISSFRIKFDGITLTNSAVLIQGFPVDSTLEVLRDRIRSSFKSSKLEHSIDARYRLQTAHLTAIRFKKPLQNRTLFLEKLQQYRNYSFGSSEITRLDLVYNDWYQKSSRVRILKSFDLS